jgi:two-component system, NtrC family, response regulator AtoC
MKALVLIVDDSDTVRFALSKQVEAMGYRTSLAASGEQALAHFTEQAPDLVLLDYHMPGQDGLEVLQEIKARNAATKVVMISGHDDSSVIVRAMKLGAENYLVQPIAAVDLAVLINRLLEEPQAIATVEDEDDSMVGIIGRSEAIQVVFRMVRRVAPTQATVLIRGESGTGKEVIAHAIHLHSRVASKPLVTVDCTSIPSNLMESELFGHEKGAFTDARSLKKGLIETADGGTLFLDELGLMPLDIQAKMLHFLETRRFRRVGGTEELEVSLRILTATNEDLEQAVSEGRFREDLFYRLNVVPIDLPPLRARGDDVLLIAEHYLKWYSTLHGVELRTLAEDAKALFRAYAWSGNVRELRNVIERAVLMTDAPAIPASALSIDRRAGREGQSTARILTMDAAGQLSVDFPAEGLAIEEVEKRLIQAALAEVKGNVSKAAALLHLSRDTLRYRIGKYELE